MSKKKLKVFDVFSSGDTVDIISDPIISKCIKCNSYEKIKWSSSGYYDGSDFYPHSDPEFPSDYKLTKLTDILLTNVDFSYLLSEKACSGIMSRSQKRSKKMSPELMEIIKSHMKNMENKDDKNK
jgi:hypothetical protein